LFKNIYTFEGCYSYKDYNEIRNIVKNQRVLSVQLDPDFMSFGNKLYLYKIK